MKALMIGVLAAATLALAGTAGIALSDDDHEGHEEHEQGEHGWRPSRRDLDPVTSARYREECGSCHFAYQPGLLPAQSWERIMGSLADHFGDDASLDAATASELSAYLVGNSADQSSRIRSRAFAAAPSAGTGLPRITETGYFVRKHDEVPARLVTGNPKVGSFSNCQACHRGADSGNFNEDDILIPGAGRWDD